jgi:beta-lactamase regulating signal transducer with metallopeptidase domain
VSAAEFLERLGWVVLHATWIGALAAAALHLALTVLSRAAAHTRHVVACAALGAVVVAVAAVAVAAFVPNLGARITSALPGPPAYVPAPIEGAPAAEVGAAGERVDTSRADRSPAIVDALVVARLAFDAAAPWVAALWLVVTGLTIARLLIALRHLARLRASLRTPSEFAGAHVGALAKRVGLARRVEVAESATVTVPIVLGLVRPIVVLPAELRRFMEPQQLDAIVLHELEHVRRRDPWVAHVQVVVEALFAFHPGVRWISHQVRLEREASCDAGVVRLTGDPRTYARALLHLADFASAARPTPVLAATGGDLVIRIRRLSGHRVAVKPRNVAVSLAGLAAACALGVAFASMPPPPPGVSNESHPYLRTEHPVLRDELGQYIVVSSRGARFAGGAEVHLEARYYPDARKARFVLSHTSLEQWLHPIGVNDAHLTLSRGDTELVRTNLHDVVAGRAIPGIIAATPLLESRNREDLSNDPGRTSRFCARFELEYALENYYDLVLLACDQPLIVPRADALPSPRSDLPTERDASFMRFVEVPGREYSVRTFEAPEPGMIQVFEVHGRASLAEASVSANVERPVTP